MIPLNILHITQWYPNHEKPYEAIWIKRLIESMPPDHQHSIYHLSVNTGKRFKMNKADGQVHRRVLELPTRRWMLIELVNFLLLAYYLVLRRIQSKHDVVNFHIAYPQLAFWPILKYFVGKPVVLSEHWSAYHYNFGVKKELPRIKRIFKQRLPLITVSESLREDIQRFAGLRVPESYILPNVVDTAEFKKQPGSVVDNRSFFMLSQWKSPKRPDVIFKTFSELIQIERFRNHTLRVGGYGDQLDQMKAMVKSLNLEANIRFLGTLTPAEIVSEMNRSSAFLHCSDYETFSVVCAEAVSCGTPVIASAVGGIPEIVDERNGILVDSNTPAEWLVALRDFDHSTFDRSSICGAANEQFCAEKVGLRYADIIKEITYAR